MRKIMFLFMVFIFLVKISFSLSLEYLGHSCFVLDINSKKIMIDPYSFELKYPFLLNYDFKNLDLVVSTHEHFDHYNELVFKICQKFNIPYFVGTKNDGNDWNPIDYELSGIRIISVNTFHDKSNGKERGKNSAIIFRSGKLKVVHLGDLGHLLDKNQVDRLKNPDILFIPVGGFFTISSSEAISVINSLSPKIIVPMHYKTKFTQDLPISKVDDFIKLLNTSYHVKFIKGRKVGINEGKIEKNTVFVFEGIK